MEQKNNKLEYHKHSLEGNLTIFEFDNRQSLRRFIYEPPVPPFVELDFSATECVDSAGIDLLSRLNRSLQEKKGKLKITNVDSTVYDVLDICGVSSLVGVELIK